MKMFTEAYNHYTLQSHQPQIHKSRKLFLPNRICSQIHSV